jgi:CheY-like chemotaxis protein
MVTAKLLACPKLAIVNGNVDMLLELGNLLDGPQYDVVFVDSDGLAYSQIKHDRPDLIVICGSIDDLDGFEVLAMLSVDEQTRQIPIVRYVTRPLTLEDGTGVTNRGAALASPAKSPARMD